MISSAYDWQVCENAISTLQLTAACSKSYAIQLEEGLCTLMHALCSPLHLDTDLARLMGYQHSERWCSTLSTALSPVQINNNGKMLTEAALQNTARSLGYDSPRSLDEWVSLFKYFDRANFLFKPRWYQATDLVVLKNRALTSDTWSRWHPTIHSLTSYIVIVALITLATRQLMNSEAKLSRFQKLLNFRYPHTHMA